VPPAACSARHFLDDILASLLDCAGKLLPTSWLPARSSLKTPFGAIQTAIDEPGASPQAFATPP
jgi:hypothetical protein